MKQLRRMLEGRGVILNRITSYNVCYTKLLRKPAVGMPVGPSEDQDGASRQAADQWLGDVQTLVASLQGDKVRAVRDVEGGGFL